ncbi:MAG: sulfur carrier protein ThiS adenylyltransferase ThiF [Victivallaceae bacterium]|jgi:sulfur carrier protein ThiS adenylyltransferase
MSEHENGRNSFKQGLLKHFSPKQLEKIESFTIGIAGAGGLGSNCAQNLVRSGFKNFVICDFDLVEPGNLNRQFYFQDQLGMLKVEALSVNLRRINPDLEITALSVKINSGNAREIFAGCDAVVEAFDRAEAKRMLVEAFYSSGKFLVSASGLAGWGNTDAIMTLQVHDYFYMVGDLVSEVGANRPPCAPRVNIAAAKQADLILSLALKQKETYSEDYNI